LINFLRSNGYNEANVESFINIDVHTGLGKQGYDTLIVESQEDKINLEKILSEEF